MPQTHKAAKLIEEGHRLWEEGRKDDALATLQAAAEVDPTLPDAWIDIAMLLHEMGEEQEALEADRKVVELGEGEEDLIAEVAQSKARLKRAEAKAGEERKKAETEEEEKRKKTEAAKVAKQYDEEQFKQAEKHMRESQETFSKVESKFNALLSEWGQLSSTSPLTWEELSDPSRTTEVQKWFMEDLSGPMNRTRSGWVEGKLTNRDRRRLGEIRGLLLTIAIDVAKANYIKITAEKRFEATNQRYLKAFNH